MPKLGADRGLHPATKERPICQKAAAALKLPPAQIKDSHQNVILAANCSTRPTLAPLPLMAAAEASPKVFTPAPLESVCGTRHVPVNVAPHGKVPAVGGAYSVFFTAVMFWWLKR